MADPIYQILFDANTGLYLDPDCLRFTITKRLADAFNPVSVGQAIIILDNETGKYSPDNSGSEYYPMRKNTYIRIDVTNGTSGYTMFSGFLDSVQVNPEPGRRTTTIYASDFVQHTLRNTRIDLELKQNINVGSLFQSVLAEGTANLPFTATFSIAALSETIPYAWFTDKPTDEAINDLLKFGDYKFYMAGEVFTVKNRSFGSSGTVVGSLVNNFLSLSYDTNFESVINKINVKGWTRKVSTSVNTIAWIADKPTIAASSRIGFRMHFVDPITLEPDTPANSVTITASSDFRTNTASDDSGILLIPTVAAIFAGASTISSITNGTSANVFLTKFQARGFSISRQAPLIYEAQDSSSQNVYGRSDFTIASDFLQTYALVKSYGDYLLSKCKERRPQINVALKNDWDNILPREVGDVLVVVESNSFVSSRWAVMEMTHEVSIERGLEHTLDMRMLKII